MPVANAATVTVPADARAVVGELRLGPLQLGQDHVGVVQQDLPGGGEPGAARTAFDEAVAGLLLQGGELLGDGGGRQVQRGGGRGHRAVVGHRTEDSQPPRIDHVPIVPGRGECPTR